MNIDKGLGRDFLFIQLYRQNFAIIVYLYNVKSLIIQNKHSKENNNILR